MSSTGGPIPGSRKISQSAETKTVRHADDFWAPAAYLRLGQQPKEDQMQKRTQDRLFALCGLAFVVAELAGTFIAMGSGGTHRLTWSSSTASIAHAFSKPTTTLV